MRGLSRTASSSSKLFDERLERWLRALVATPGLTSIRSLDEARRVHIEESLSALPVLARFEGPIVDVGSGGGAPGIPLAVALPDRTVVLLEATGRKCTFLRRWAAEFPNVHVVHGRAEEQDSETFGAAVAKALAPPVVAVEWCLPLVRSGGAVILYVGPTADGDAVAKAAGHLAGGPVELAAGLFVISKRGRTPAGFPRRPGIARKRPLA